MVTVLGIWETDWMDPERSERRIWKQTIQAFAVDRWCMCPAHGLFTSPIQFPDLESMLAAHPGPRTFLIPPGRVESSVDLAGYTHPEDAVYVFGNSAHSLVPCVRECDDVVSIFTPSKAAMFGHAALAAVLYDWMVKH